jgi:hypothetical protein
MRSDLIKCMCKNILHYPCIAINLQKYTLLKGNEHITQRCSYHACAHVLL